MASIILQKDMAGTVCDVRIVEEAEVCLPPPYSAPPRLPLWLRLLTASLHVFVVLLTATVIGLLVHTVSTYSRTRGIKFGGAHYSWPADLDLGPVVFFFVVASVSLLASLVGTLLTLLRLKRSPFCSLEIASVTVSLALLLLWITGDIIEGQSERTPKRSLLSWACRRERSPTNVLVRYGSICEQQVCLCRVLLGILWLNIISKLLRVLLWLSPWSSWA